MAQHKANGNTDLRSGNFAELNHDEATEFTRCKEIVQKGLATFIEVGQALLTIQARQLYRATHTTFESFCKAEFDLNRSYAYRLIDSAKIVDELSPIGDNSPLPSTESQLRELTALPNADLRRDAWQRVVEASSKGSGPITAKLIREVVALSKAPSKKSSRFAAPGDPDPKPKLPELLAQLEKELKDGNTQSALAMVTKLKRALKQLMSS